MIERNGDLVFCDAFFLIESNIEFEDLGIEHPIESCPFRFRLDELQCFYGGTENKTTIHLKSGISFSLDIPLNEFDKFIVDQSK
jgi:hypothetical protein